MWMIYLILFIVFFPIIWIEIQYAILDYKLVKIQIRRIKKEIISGGGR
jgi:hypothetical protein